MPNTQETVAAIEAAGWNARINLVRQIPEEYGTASHRKVYAALASHLYVPQLTPDFAYVLPRPEYDLEPVTAALREALRLTDGFTLVTEAFSPGVGRVTGVTSVTCGVGVS